MKSKLPTGWEEFKLGEIIELHDSKRIPLSVKVRSKQKKSYPYYGANGIIDYVENYIFEGEHILLAEDGSVVDADNKPIVYYVSDKFWVSNHAHVFKSIESKCSQLFLYYALKNINILPYITGAVQLKINQGNLKRIPIILPPLSEQNIIADTLSALDDKIENNNKINENLEAQAQAIFKHWFVDFEFPNEDDRPYKSDGGKMFESELGLIPEGWKAGQLQDIGDIVGGSTPSRKKEEYFTEKGIPWLTPRDLSNNDNLFIDKGETDITEEGFNSTSIQKLPVGSVLFSSRAPIGYIAIAKNEITTNQGFKSVVPINSKGVSTIYIYCWLKENIRNIENRASGSTFKEISGGELKKVTAIIPNKDILIQFEKSQEDIVKKLELNEDENKVLIELRNTLLPKLMSGELRIPLG